MNTISNASLKMTANISAMNKAKKLPEVLIGTLLDSASQQQTQMQQSALKSAAEATGMGQNLDIKA